MSPYKIAYHEEVTSKELLHQEVEQLSERDALLWFARLREPGAPNARPTLRDLARLPVAVRAAWLADVQAESESELVVEWEAIDPGEPEVSD